MALEKRKHHRIAVNAFIRFHRESLSQLTPRYYQGIIKNYSRSGAFIATKRLLPKGSLLTLEIPIENETMGHLNIIQVRGVIRRVQDTPGKEGIGIAFFELRDAEHDDFNEWMKNYIT
jgi:hypothetical protein